VPDPNAVTPLEAISLSGTTNVPCAMELLEELENEELQEELDENELELLEFELELELNDPPHSKNSMLVICPVGASMSEIRLISKSFDQSIATGGLLPPGEAGISTVAIVLRAGISCCSRIVQVSPDIL